MLMLLAFHLPFEEGLTTPGGKLLHESDKDALRKIRLAKRS